MTDIAKSVEKDLPSILNDFNEVLKKHKIQGEVLRFMVGDSENPEHARAQEKLEKMLASLKVDDGASTKAWVCCDAVRCYYCDIA